jgi:hypothetical protein
LRASSRGESFAQLDNNSLNCNTPHQLLLEGVLGFRDAKLALAPVQMSKTSSKVSSKS